MKNYLFVLTVALGIFICSSKANAYTLCTNNGSTSSSAITETGDCYTQPDIHKVTFYRIALCKSQPTAPTSTSAAGTGSCVDIFRNVSGSTITIQNGTTVGLSGNTAVDSGGRLNISDGSYGYMYMEASPSFQQQKTAYFSSSRNNSDSSSSGVKCWSLPVTTYSYSSGTVVATTCGVSGATETGLGLTTAVVNTLNGAVGFVNSMSFSCNAPASTINANLITSAGLLATGVVNGLGTIAKVSGYTQLGSPFVIANGKQQSVSSLNIGFLNSGGTAVSQGGGVMSVFSGGPFCAYLKSYSL